MQRGERQGVRELERGVRPGERRPRGVGVGLGEQAQNREAARAKARARPAAEVRHQAANQWSRGRVGERNPENGGDLGWGRPRARSRSLRAWQGQAGRSGEQAVAGSRRVGLAVPTPVRQHGRPAGPPRSARSWCTATCPARRCPRGPPGAPLRMAAGPQRGGGARGASGGGVQDSSATSRAIGHESSKCRAGACQREWDKVRWAGGGRRASRVGLQRATDSRRAGRGQTERARGLRSTGCVRAPWARRESFGEVAAGRHWSAGRRASGTREAAEPWRAEVS